MPIVHNTCLHRYIALVHLDRTATIVGEPGTKTTKEDTSRMTDETKPSAEDEQTDEPQSTQKVASKKAKTHPKLRSGG